MNARVLVTCPPMLGIFDDLQPVFERKAAEFTPAKVTQTMSEEELIATLPAYDGWIIGDDPATARVLEAGKAGKLRAIVKWGVGVDNVDFEAARALGLPARNTPGVFGREVADIAMGYVIGLARETFLIDRQIRLHGSWPKPAGISLAGRTAAVVGFGDIGRNTARRLAAAEMNVIAYDPEPGASESLPVRRELWPEALGEADFIIFTCPLVPSTRHMLDRDLLSRLKPGVRIVNVARGPVIDEQALLAGLESGTIHSAALDVFEDEPLPIDHPLRGYERCIFGSHNASNTRDAAYRVSCQAIDMLCEFLDA